MPDNWLWLVLGAVGAFTVNQVWPFIRSLIDMNYRAEIEQHKAETTARRAERDHQEERYLAALELSAQAQRQQAENGREISAAIRIISETRVADNLVLQRVDRELEKALTLLVELAALQERVQASDTRVRPTRRRVKVVKDKEVGGA